MAQPADRGQLFDDGAGVGANGQPLLSGQYTLQLASSSQGEVTSVNPVAHYAYIGEARQGLDGIELVMDGGVIVPSEQVTALREPVGAAG